VKKLAKRALSGLMTIIMVMSLLCVGAQAATVNEKSSDNSTAGTAQSITLGDEVNGEIWQYGDIDFYTFTLTEEGRFSFQVTSYIEYYSLFIYDTLGNVVWSGKNNHYNSAVGFIKNDYTLYLNSGTYYFQIDGNQYWSEGTVRKSYTGKYILQTDFISADANEIESNGSAVEANPITLGNEIKGQISENDLIDFYTFTLDRAGTIELTITSYMGYYSLFIYDTSGNTVWQSKGNAYNSLAGYITNTHTVQLSSGTYFLQIDGNLYWAEGTVRTITRGFYTVQTGFSCSEHIWNGGEVTTQPTTSTTGIKTYTCTVCGETKTEEIAKLPVSNTDTNTTPDNNNNNTITPTVTFTDVPSSQYYYASVYWAVGKGITNGTGGSSFSPDVNCTRSQIVTFLWRAAGEPEPTISNPFTDISEGAYYYKAVLWAYEKGITTGTSATQFSPLVNCSRSQIVTFLWRYEGKPSASVSGAFTDVASNDFYTTAVYWAVANSITNGTGGSSFSPSMTCTRAQAVTFLYRCMK
jgi:hypothetical protein